MSWRPMFQVGRDPEFYGNAQRYATKEEAEDSARARYNVWTSAVAWRVEESDDLVNYAIIDGQDTRVNRGTDNE
jgi:hypothetical protein